MLGQIAIHFISVIFTGLLAYLVYALSTAVKYSGTGVFAELAWMLPNAPAINEFIMFVLQAGIAAAIPVCAMLQVSNHIILTLDILYFLSLCMLILYHMIKEAGIPCFSVNA